LRARRCASWRAACGWVRCSPPRRSSPSSPPAPARQPRGPVDGAGRVFFARPCCSPGQRVSGTSSRPTSSRSRGCLLGLFFRLRWACRRIWGLLQSEPLTVLELTGGRSCFVQDRRGDRLGEARPPRRGDSAPGGWGSPLPAGPGSLPFVLFSRLAARQRIPGPPRNPRDLPHFFWP